MTMTPPSDHPLRALLADQGRSLVWLAGRLGCGPQTLANRLSGHRPGGGLRGPKPWAPAPVVIVKVAAELGITPKKLARWLAGETP